MPLLGDFDPEKPRLGEVGPEKPLLRLGSLPLRNLSWTNFSPEKPPRLRVYTPGRVTVYLVGSSKQLKADKQSAKS